MEELFFAVYVRGIMILGR